MKIQRKAEIKCSGCREIMIVVLGGKIEIQSKNENLYDSIFCESCYRKQKELVDQIRELSSRGGDDYN